MNIRSLKTLFIIVIWINLIFPGTNSVYAQDTLVVKGQVVNGSGQPVSKVSISVEGSSELPVVTNESGVFSVELMTGNEWLIVEPSSKYKRKRINVNNRSELKIYLTSNELASGDDKVTILSQDRIKQNLVTANSSLSTENIEESDVLSFDQYLQGRVPGLYVVNRTGDPGSGAFTLLHGINSLNASNEPMYIIDGMPISSMGVFGSNLDGYSYNPLLSVNTLDISQITIVKDPVLTAAYGSKASNGLIIVQTLNPSATQTVIDLDIRSGYSLAPSNDIPQLDAGQHRTLISEELFSSGMHEELIREKYPNLFLTPKDDRYIDYQHNTDWQDLIFRNAMLSNVNLNVKGGDEIAKYGLSFGYLNSNGIINKTGYDGYNLRFVSLLNMSNWLKMNAGVSMNYNMSNLKESAKVRQTSPVFTALAKSPMLNPFQYDNEGRELTSLAPVDELGVSNPQAVISNYEAKNSNFHFISTLGAEATLKKNLKLTTNFGLGYDVFKELIFMPNKGMELYYNDEAINVSKEGNNSLTSFYNNTHLLFDKGLGNHHITSNTGFNILTNNFEYDWALTKNASANDQYRALQDGINNLREIGGNNRNWNWFSLYENINYSYLDKYLVSASVSLDGSSRIGEEASNTIKIGSVPFGLFYGGGLGWRLSNESFMKNISWLEELKLRLTYGKTGNDDIGEANATNYYNAIKFRETVGLYPALVPNPKLTYETVSQLDAGLDIALWGNRLTANVDFYSSVTDNMLIYRPLDSYFGYSSRPENGGQMENKGLDVGFFFRIISGSDFKWDFQASWSTVKNRVTEIKGDKLVTELEGAEIVNMAGEQANSFYGYIFKGVYSTTEEAQKANLVNQRSIPYQAGDAIFADLSGPDGIKDGIIDDYDKTVIGSSLPEQFGGINNTFTYKRWAVSAFVQFVQGNEIFNYVRFKNESMTGLENQSTNVLNRWQYEGQQTEVPRAKWEDPVGNSSFSTRWIEDGSFIRIKNIVLNYTIDNEFLTFRNAKFYLSANNIFTFTNYLGYDPEFGYSHSQLDQGIDYGLTPQPRQFIIGVKLGL
ncbi:MAG TPA: SusC/RagA family TonB-linked outer membrane protein [Bacteroidales bacterium]|nr:SusC/RagA family TonB-linked outer membrane protein [Bacteroidales bacterium]